MNQKLLPVFTAIACALLVSVSPSTSFGAGVTVITHGYQGDVTWVDSMAEAITDRAGQSSEYVIRIGNGLGGGPLEIEAFYRESGPVLLLSQTAEIILKVDWTDVDGGICAPGFPTVVPTSEIASLIAFALTNTSFYDTEINPLDLPPGKVSFAELPLHFIGHSRGGSLVVEVTRILGSAGIWVDQVTTLDPHPIECDAPVLLHDNIVFADNYYQELGPFIDGIPLADTYYRKLTELDGGYDGIFGAHSDVHLWYFGTIKLGDDVSNGDQTITGSVRDTWYWGIEARGSQTGFYYSRNGGGVRRRPAWGVLGKHLPLSREAEGAVRLSPAIGGVQWPNVDHIQSVGSVLQAGGPLNVTFHHQDRGSGATLSWFLDSDLNPHNGLGLQLGDPQPASATGNAILREETTLSTEGVTAGTYHLCAKIVANSSGLTRYVYGLRSIIFWLGAPPVTPTPTITSISPTSLPGLPLPQTQLLTIYGTDFTSDSELQFFDGSTTYSKRVPTFVSETELHCNIKVGNISANWTVKVVNGSEESGTASFAVIATPDPDAPAAPTDLVATFAGGISDTFYYVDWTNPSDASGLAKVWWKLGSPPTSPEDGVGFILPDLKPLPVSSMTTNPETLYIWLEDGAENKDHNNYSSVLLFRDTGVPFVVTPSQDRTVIEGASAVFSVVVGGAEPLFYQWQKDAMNITGATLPTYVTPPASLSDSSSQYRVVVTNAFGAITSSVATLTVNAANTVTWTGVVSSEWNNPSNWSPATVPSASDRVVINSGGVNALPSSSFAVLELNGGYIFGDLQVTGTLTWSSGWLLGGANGPSGVVNVVGDEQKDLAGTFNNAGTVNLLGSSRLECGNGIAADGQLYIGGTFDNAGLVNCSGIGGIRCYKGFGFNNLPGALFEMQGDAQIWAVAGPIVFSPSVFDNAGTLRKTGGTGTSYIGITLTNSGVVQVHSGTLGMGGLSNTGVLSVGAGATMLFGGEDFVFDAGTLLDAAPGGTVEYRGGSIWFDPDATVTSTTANLVTGYTFTQFSGDVNLPNFELAGGVLGGPFTNAGTLTWSSGWLLGGANGPSGVVNVVGDEQKDLAGTFNNAGTVNLLGSGRLDCGYGVYAGGQEYTGGTFDNAGLVNWSGIGGIRCYNGFGFNNLPGALFEMQGDAQIWAVAGPIVFSPSVFDNAGTLRKTGGTGTSYIGITVTNTATVEVQSGTLGFADFHQSAGNTVLAVGTLSGSPLNFEGGVMLGSGLIDGSVINSAEVSPGVSPGKITIDGSYTQTSDGKLTIEIGGTKPGSQHDQLVVNGPVTLDGTLEVALTDGFSPNTGDSFELLSFGSRSGDFSSSNADQLGLTEKYTPDGLLLIDGTNAFPKVSFSIPSGSTQLVCMPFHLQATAADVDGSLTNLAVELDGLLLGTSGGPSWETTVEIDSPGTYLFTASGADDVGGIGQASQSVTVVSLPLHVLQAAGFRTNGLFKLCMQGISTNTYQVLVTDDPTGANWVPIGLMEYTNGVMRFFDTDATNHSQRFYRAEQSP